MLGISLVYSPGPEPPHLAACYPVPMSAPRNPPRSPSHPPQGLSPQGVADLAPQGAITPLLGNRGALVILLLQQLLSGVLAAIPVVWLWATGRVTQPLPLGLLLIATFLLTWLVAAVSIRPVLERLFQDARWRTPPHLGAALGGFALAFMASRAVAAFVLSVYPGSVDMAQDFRTSGSDYLPLMIGAVLLIPLAEEIAFRGLLLRGLEWARGSFSAALISSLFFALAHGGPLQVFAILPLAWIMARAVQYSGSLWTSYLIHALNNFTAIGVLYLSERTDLLSGLSMDRSSAVSLPLPLGAAALLFGLLLIAGATAWLRPRPELRGVGGRIWTPALFGLALLVIVSVVVVIRGSAL